MRNDLVPPNSSKRHAIVLVQVSVCATLWFAEITTSLYCLAKHSQDHTAEQLAFWCWAVKLRVVLPPVLVLYCCVADDPQTLNLKRANLCQLLEVRNWETA